MTRADQLISSAVQAVIVSVVRLVVPMVVGLIVTVGLQAGFAIDPAAASSFTLAAIPLVAGYLWYVVGRLVEMVNAKTGGRMLGWIAQPVYSGGSGFVASLWRTLVPYVVSWLIVGANWLRLDLDSATAEQLVIGVLSIVVAVAYQLIVRLLETLKSSKFGWLLGYAPKYVTYGRHAAV